MLAATASSNPRQIIRELDAAAERSACAKPSKDRHAKRYQSDAE
jgi:hypothetical protein